MSTCIPVIQMAYKMFSVLHGRHEVNTLLSQHLLTCYNKKKKKKASTYRVNSAVEISDMSSFLKEL